MVVQCPNCQTKFRLADDKVTARGVRVRCTSCKNLFQVAKDGSATGDAAPRAPGPPAQPAPPRPAGSRALDAADLFGMDELTGEAPPRPPLSKPAQAMPDFDSISLEDDRPEPPRPIVSSPRPPTGPVPARPATGPVAARPATGPVSSRPATGPVSSRPATGPVSSRPATGPVPAPPPPPPPDPDAPAVALDDPFEGLTFGGEAPPPLSVEERAAARPKSAPAPRPAPELPPLPPGRQLVSAALTGLLGAGLAVAVMVTAALRDHASATSWMGLVRGSELAPAHLASGLYDTAGGKPVYFVRGMVENRSERVQGPVRVVAELVGESGEVRATAIAGLVPSPEDVQALRSAADAERLERSLERPGVERRLQPGTSLPFFALFPEPPELAGVQLRVRVELADGWAPRGPRADRDR